MLLQAQRELQVQREHARIMQGVGRVMGGGGGGGLNNTHSIMMSNGLGRAAGGFNYPMLSSSMSGSPSSSAMASHLDPRLAALHAQNGFPSSSVGNSSNNNPTTTEMDEILHQQYKEKISNCSSLDELVKLRGKFYNPVLSSSSSSRGGLSGSAGSSTLLRSAMKQSSSSSGDRQQSQSQSSTLPMGRTGVDDFTSEEIYEEMTRRRLQQQQLQLQQGLGGERIIGGGAAAAMNMSGRNSSSPSGNEFSNGKRRSNNSLQLELGESLTNNSEKELLEMYNQISAHNTAPFRRESEDALSTTGNMSMGGISMGGGVSLGGMSMNSFTPLALLGGSGSNANNKNDIGVEQEEPQQTREGEEDSEEDNEATTKDLVIMVSTDKPASKLVAKQQQVAPTASTENNEEDITNNAAPNSAGSTVVTTEDPDEKHSPLKKRKRCSSTSSFDALLSAFGDDLNELDKEKNGRGGNSDDDDNKSAASSTNLNTSAHSLLMDNLIEHTKDTLVARIKQESATGVNNKRRRSSSRSSFSSIGSIAEETGEQCTQSVLANGNTNSNSMLNSLLDRESVIMSNDRSSNPTESDIMAKLEAMRREEMIIRKRVMEQQQERMFRVDAALRHQAMINLGMIPGPSSMMGGMTHPPPRHHQGIMPPGGYSDHGRLAGLFGGRPSAVNIPQPSPPHGNATDPRVVDALYKMRYGSTSYSGSRPAVNPKKQISPKARPIVHEGKTSKSIATSGKKRPGGSSKPKPLEDPDKDVLADFLEKYGAPADESCNRMLDAIAKTEESLVSLFEWDRKQGLRKCHSRTVVKTRRSRERLKTFLNSLKEEDRHKLGRSQVVSENRKHEMMHNNKKSEGEEKKN